MVLLVNGELLMGESPSNSGIGVVPRRYHDVLAAAAVDDVPEPVPARGPGLFARDVVLLHMIPPRDRPRTAETFG